MTMTGKTRYDAHMVPGHLVHHNWSPIDWSLGTNGPQKFSPHGLMVPNQFGPLHKWSLEYSICLGGQEVGDQKSRDLMGWGPYA